jgi:RNA polymerase sigma factor (sigma-70 family)
MHHQVLYGVKKAFSAFHLQCLSLTNQWPENDALSESVFRLPIVNPAMPKQRKLELPDDQELWMRFRSGDASAHNALATRYARRLFNYAIRFSQDRDLIKDCVQDIFLELWNGRTRISETPSVQSYLFKAMRRRVFREQTKWLKDIEYAENMPFEAEFNIETRLIADQSLAELSQKMQRLLNTFPQRQKEILYLRFYENLDHERIGQVMGLTRQSVYNLQQKALIRLRREWLNLAVLLLTLGHI